MNESRGDDTPTPGPDQLDSFAAQHLRIIGIGASAGGLEALQQFFNFAPIDRDISYVIVQHLMPERPSLLSEILARHTKMRIVEVVTATRLEPNTVYIIAPATVMWLEGHSLVTRKRNRDEHFPIDTLFFSLAHELRSKAIAVIFSGTGTDGTLGCDRIRENRGTVLAQDPATAQFESMPSSVIRSGAAQIIASPASLASRLTKEALDDRHEDDSDELERLLISRVLASVSRHTGVDFRGYKYQTLKRQIHRVLNPGEDSMRGLRRMVEELDTNSGLAERLCDEITIGVTEFFRDKPTFESLYTHVVVPLVRDLPEDDALRIWVAACSTGQEAYSIGMLFLEAFEAEQKLPAVKIFATDLNETSLQIARLGMYGHEQLAGVDETRKARFFNSRRDGSFVACEELRSLMVFARHDITRDPPFSKCDLVSCRNLLIYFQTALQKRTFCSLEFAIKDSGFMLLGQSEAPPTLTRCMPIDRARRIFQADTSGRVHSDLSSEISLASYKPQFDRAPPPTPPSPRPVLEGPSGQSGTQSILAGLLPDCLIVNAVGDIVYSQGNLSNYVRLRDGQLSLNVFSMVAPALRQHLGSMLQEAWLCQSPLTQSIRLDVEELPAEVAVSVHPFSMPPTHTPVAIIQFLDAAAEAQSEQLALEQLPPTPKTTLSAQLSAVRGDLEASLAQQEATSEELQTANEELIAANEELQATNEELQAANEELHTVNAEFQEKIEELTELHNDLRNLFDSVDIGVLFLDLNLCIRKFNTATAHYFRLIESDNGRSIRDIAHPFQDYTIADDLDQLLLEIKSFEREVITRDGRAVQIVARPYRVQNSNVTGVVVTIADISRLRQETARADTLLRTFDDSRSHLCIVGRKLEVRHLNNSLETLTGLKGHRKGELFAHEIFDTNPPTPDGLRRIMEVVRVERVWSGRLRVATKTAGDHLDDVTIVGSFDPLGKLQHAVISGMPATLDTVREGRNVNRDIESHLHSLALSSYWEMNAATGEGRGTPELFRMVGLHPHDGFAPFDNFVNHIPEDSREIIMQSQAKAISEGHPYDLEFHVRLPGLTTRRYFAQGDVIRRPDGTQTQALCGTIQDITMLGRYLVHFPDAPLAIVDRKGRAAAANPLAREMLEQREGQLRLIDADPTQSSLWDAWFDACLAGDDPGPLQLDAAHLGHLQAKRDKASASVSAWWALDISGWSDDHRQLVLVGSTVRPRVFAQDATTTMAPALPELHATQD